jgi:hypothetical protein
MRRFVIAALTALLAAGALAAGAAAKEANVELSSTPFGTHPGEPWNVTMTVWAAGDRPVIGPSPTLTVRNLGTGERIVVRAKPTGEPGKYAARVVFPVAARYSYEVYDPTTDRRYTFPVVRIVAAPAADAPASDAPRTVLAPAGGSDSFPLWPVVGGGLAALAALGLAGAVIRAARLRGSARGRSGAPAAPPA